MLKKLLILMGVIALMILTIFVINHSGDVNSSDYLDEQLIDSLRVGVHYDIKNMGFQQYYDDELTGFEIDFSKQLAKHIYGKESLIELTNVSNKTAKYYLKNKTIDCIIATQPQTDEKSEEYLYSKPYYTDYVECIYVNGSIMSLNDLSGKRVAVIADSYAANTIMNLAKNNKINIEFVEFEGYSDALEAVQLGKLDAFCTNRVNVPGSTLKRFTIGDCKYVVVVRKSDKDLLDKINSAIYYLESSGELKVMQDKYR